MKHHNPLLTALVLLLSATLGRAQNTQTFTFQGFVFQTYTIPVSGYYLLTSKGGEGGSFRYVNDPSDRFIGGKGASMSCYYFFNEGEQLRIAVAGAGQSVVDNGEGGNGNIEDGAGGGGASSIALVNGNSYLPVLIAGGGGAGMGRDGDAGQVTQNGTQGRKYNGQTGGSAGVAGGGSEFRGWPVGLSYTNPCPHHSIHYHPSQTNIFRNLLPAVADRKWCEDDEVGEGVGFIG